MQLVNSCFTLIPPGKFDASKGVGRKKYSGQKGDTCMHYALTLLANDKKPPKSDNLAKIITTHRKQMTQLKKDYELSETVTSQSINLPLQLLKALLEKGKDAKAKIMFAHLIEFREQNEFQEFDKYLEVKRAKEYIKIHKVFLSNLRPNFDDVPKLEPLPLNAFLHNAVFVAISGIYGCKGASWNPEKGIDELIEQLKQFGPLLIHAKMGQSYYESDPQLLSEKIEGRNVYGWPPHSARRNSKASHTVILVGAKKEITGKGFVYFLDPIDPSEPDQPHTQKVYKSSYERLLTELNNVMGLPFAEAKQSGEQQPFAFHM